MSEEKSKKNSASLDVETSISYPVYVIYSRWSVSEIKNFLCKYASTPTDIGPMRIDYTRSGQETDRTIVILNPTLYQRLVKEGFSTKKYPTDFSIAVYKLRKYNLPPVNSTPNFFIRLPEHHSLLASDYRLQVQNKLTDLVLWGFFKRENFRIDIPLVSRQSDEARGTCFVFFDNVPVETIAMAKIILDETYWKTEYDQQDENDDDKTGSRSHSELENEESEEHVYHTPIMKCFWAKKKVKE